MGNTIGGIIIGIGMIFVLFGYIGMYRFKDFYTRILISSKADTVGLLTILAGVIIMEGFSFFSLKVMIILIFSVLLTPITTHAIARSAYLSGYKVRKEKRK